MQQYKNTLQYVRDHGVMRGDRTGVGRHGLFSPPDEIYDLSKGFPLATIREINPAATIDELCWFISGSTNIDELKFKFFWKRWCPTEEDAKKFCDEHGIDYRMEDGIIFPWNIQKVLGTIGNLYGVSWRNAPGPKGKHLPTRPISALPESLVEKFVPYGPDDKPIMSVQGLAKWLDTSAFDSDAQEFKDTLRGQILDTYWSNFDQLNELIYKIKTTPNSSRLRVSAYLTDYMAFEEFTPQENVLDGRACLTPCHTFFQCYVNPGEDGQKPKLDLKLTLTSSDVPVGRIYNIAQYALLCEMIAHVCDMEAGRLIISTGDAHIYSNQFEAVEKMLANDPLPLSTLWLNPEIKNIFDFKPEDIKIIGYQSHEKIDVPVAL